MLNMNAGNTDSERDSWTKEFEKIYVAESIPENEFGFKVLIRNCSLAVFREFEQWCRDKGIYHKKVNFYNNSIVITEIGISNAHARTTGAIERQVQKYSFHGSGGNENTELINYRDAERVLGGIFRGPDGSYGGPQSHCPHLIIEVARGQPLSELCYYARAFLEYSVNVTCFLGVKLYVSPGITNANNFEMLCVVYEKGHGTTVQGAVPTRIISFGTAAIQHPLRLADITNHTGTHVGAMEGHTGGVNTQQCNQAGLDPPFIVHLPTAGLFAPMAPPATFGANLDIDLYSIQVAAITGHLSD